jgi:hypothetical protein
VRRVAGIDEASLTAGLLFHQQRVAVKLLPDPELVQVAVGPALRRLDVFVELVEDTVLDLDAPPDCSLRVGHGFLL